QTCALPILSKCLLTPFVLGASRVPLPPASTIPFMQITPIRLWITVHRLRSFYYCLLPFIQKIILQFDCDLITNVLKASKSMVILNSFFCKESFLLVCRYFYKYAEIYMKKQ